MPVSWLSGGRRKYILLAFAGIFTFPCLTSTHAVNLLSDPLFLQQLNHLLIEWNEALACFGFWSGADTDALLFILRQRFAVDDVGDLVDIEAVRLDITPAEAAQFAYTKAGTQDKAQRTAIGGHGQHIQQLGYLRRREKFDLFLLHLWELGGVCRALADQVVFLGLLQRTFEDNNMPLHAGGCAACFALFIDEALHLIRAEGLQTDPAQ